MNFGTRQFRHVSDRTQQGINIIAQPTAPQARGKRITRFQRPFDFSTIETRNKRSWNRHAKPICLASANQPSDAEFGHKFASGVQVYRRGDALEKRRELMAAWESYCENATAGNVVRLTVERPRNAVREAASEDWFVPTS
jgi:hypothetical protein